MNKKMSFVGEIDHLIALVGEDSFFPEYLQHTLNNLCAMVVWLQCLV